MQHDDFPAQVLPTGTRSLVDQVPPAPPGTIFVLAEDGGYAVPPSPYALLFGRDSDEVHVTVGADDPHVSRKHGVFTCVGREWWVRNTGSLPIELPDSILLTGHERRIDAGFTPLMIRSSRRQPHLVEVRVTGGGRHHAACGAGTTTRRPEDVYELTPQQRLILTALAQRYLVQDRYPQPLTWRQVAECLNHVPATGKAWTARSVESKVGVVRKQLSQENGVVGLTREEVGEPVGNLLNHNLIMELLRTATLVADDLHLLGLDPDNP